MPARVINIKDAPEGWQASPQYVYIGRAGHGQDGYFGNPIRLSSESQRDDVLKQYVEHFRHRWLDAEFRRRLAALPSNVVLVCFCAPKACHGDVIAKTINWINATEDY